MAALTGTMTADFSDFVIEVDRSVVRLKELEGASGRTSGAIGEFSEGMSAADKMLSLFGIRIGPQIQAVRELGSAAGKTASDIGLIGTAGLTVAAAVGGWQIGRAVADFFSLDEAIGNATASLLGFGDVAAQTAAARFDVLSRATTIAGRAITDFGEAQKIIATHTVAMAESLNTGTARVAQWNAEIARHRDDMPTITAELKNHSSTVQQLATHYNISKEAIEWYTRGVEASTKAQKAWADEARPRYEAITKAQTELNEAMGGWHKTLDTIPPALAKAGTEALNYTSNQNTIALALGLTTTQVAALDRQMKLNLATMAATEPALGSLDAFVKENATSMTHWYEEMAFASTTIASDLNPQVEELNTKLRFTSEVVGELPDQFAALSAAAMAGPMGGKNAPGSASVNVGDVQFQDLNAAFNNYNARYGGGSSLGMIGGGPTPDFLSWALASGQAQRPTVNNTFNIVDTESGIARRVSDEVGRTVQQGSLVS